MALLFGKLRGRKALAFLKHRRFWENGGGSGPGISQERVTEDGEERITEDGEVRMTEGVS